MIFLCVYFIFLSGSDASHINHLITKYMRYNNLVSIDRWRYARLSVYVNTYIPVSQSLHTSWNSYIILHHHLPPALISLYFFFTNIWSSKILEEISTFSLGMQLHLYYYFWHMNQGCFAFSVVTISSWALGFRYIYYIKKKAKKTALFCPQFLSSLLLPPKCYSRGDLFPFYENVSESSQVSRR